MIKTPSFWWLKFSWISLALLPLSFIYGLISSWRMKHSRRKKVLVPVICVGNFVMGGAGKTPTSLALAVAAMNRGLKPGFLSRGYGRKSKHPILVDVEKHGAFDVGDEALMLAAYASTVVSHNRVEGANLLIKEAVDIIIMDDGFQTSQLIINLSFGVIDLRRGLGNLCVFPAGPLRVPLKTQASYADIILCIGDKEAMNSKLSIYNNLGKPVYFAKLQPKLGFDYFGIHVLAFSGIADPKKFFLTVKSLGAVLVESYPFADHAVLKDEQITFLLTRAEQKKLKLVTTAKDAARLTNRLGIAQELLSKILIIEVELVFEDPLTPLNFIDRAVTLFKEQKSLQ
ncbi:Tetraacyldisaccharide 4'-kinase [Liberibacter crescens BT-1]|uniref:Tetraacyldisaccharide 4'-kinase n=1 Tax=Liberibacter crescens (strain BT-1) TaxID=1215343 RepID=L0EU87_LIBCB|nr:tetraacyldisaccharide 4'-kinase [Liberibacter crescens]AGA64228.1 Tetraacyldisaccharide 4'-kinase [Liberibacter crescens BT-1]AMC12473.1 tetraacyldisaccharide 4'-kinase [Liberibacter crescens]